MKLKKNRGQNDEARSARGSVRIWNKVSDVLKQCVCVHARDVDASRGLASAPSAARYRAVLLSIRLSTPRVIGILFTRAKLGRDSDGTRHTHLLNELSF